MNCREIGYHETIVNWQQDAFSDVETIVESKLNGKDERNMESQWRTTKNDPRDEGRWRMHQDEQS